MPWDGAGDSSWPWTRGGASRRPSISLSRPEGWPYGHSNSQGASPLTAITGFLSVGLEEGPGGPRVWSLQSPCQAVGLAFFGSMVATYRAGTLSQRDARRFVTSFLEAKAKSLSSRHNRGTGEWTLWPRTLHLPCSGLLTRVRAPKTPSMAQGAASSPSRLEAVGLAFGARAGLGLTQSSLGQVLG